MTKMHQIPLAAQWAFAGAAVVAGCLIPESPHFYLQAGRIDKAKSAYKRLVAASDLDVKFAELQRSINLSQQITATQPDQTRFIDCFKGPNLRRTRIIIWANLLQQLLGVTLLANLTYFLQLAGMSATDSLLITQIGVVIVLVANVISWYTMTRFGRRIIMLASSIIAGVLWISVGTAGCFQSSTALWYIGIGMMVTSFALQSGVGGAWPVVSGETSTLRLRAKSQGIAWISNAFFSWLFNFVVPYMFTPDEGDLGGKAGFIFAGLSFAGFVLIWFEIPEMKNRTATELDEMFEQKLATRKFKKQVCAVEAVEHEKPGNEEDWAEKARNMTTTHETVPKI
jgi:MFS family permease